MAKTLTTISKKVTTNEKSNGYTTTITARHTFSIKDRKFKLIYHTDSNSSGHTRTVEIFTDNGWKLFITTEDVVCDIQDSSKRLDLIRNYNNFEVSCIQYIVDFF